MPIYYVTVQATIRMDSDSREDAEDNAIAAITSRRPQEFDWDVVEVQEES